MGIPTMSLYNYFPNHAALLSAVGDYAFSLFRFPKSQLRKPWQETLLAWLWAVDRHFERHPIAFKMISVEGQVSPAWSKVQEPLLEVMAGLGLKGKELTFALCWFTSQAIGLMLVEASAHPSRQLGTQFRADANSETAEQVLRELIKHKPAIRREDILEFGFRGMIRSLEQLLP
jgi:AcrR family transcriptional regulator